MKKNSGFTIIELIIAVALAGLIFLASSSVMFALFSSNTRVHQLDALAKTKADLNLELSQNARWAKSIEISDNGHTLTLIDAIRPPAVYHLDTNSHILTKNGERIHTDEVLITDFLVEDYSLNSTITQKSIVITIELEHKTFNAVKETLRLGISQRYAT